MTRSSPGCGSRSVTWTGLLTLSLRRTLENMDSTPALACTLDAFDDAMRPRYEELRTGVRRAVLEVKELVDGFALRVSPEPAVLGGMGEWIALERRCCPFLDFTLEIPHAEAHAWLRITGPEGAKEILRQGMQEPIVSADRLRGRR